MKTLIFDAMYFLYIYIMHFPIVASDTGHQLYQKPV